MTALPTLFTKLSHVRVEALGLSVLSMGHVFRRSSSAVAMTCSMVVMMRRKGTHDANSGSRSSWNVTSLLYTHDGNLAEIHLIFILVTYLSV